jgi:cobalt/nickel transport system permease protein
MPFVSYWVFRTVKGTTVSAVRMSLAAFLSGYIGLTLSAVLVAIQLGIQPLIAQGPDGQPLYAPYPLSVALPVVALEHLLLFSIVEGMLTVLLFKYFLKNEPDLIYAVSGKVV